MKPLSKLVEEYIRHLSIERGLAKNTISSYRRDLAHYLQFLDKAQILAPSEITAFTITAFMKSMSESEALSANTLARLLAAIRGLHRFWLFESITRDDPSALIKPPKLPRRLPKAISVFEVEKLLDAAGPDPDRELAEQVDVCRIRDRAILELLYATGARISEITALNLDDLLDPTMIRLFGKGSKSGLFRLVPLLSAP